MVPSFHRIESSQRTIGGQATNLDAPFYSMLKTHAGRRTYATINYIHNNKSISSVMAVTGHAKESTFLNYVRANDIDRVKNYSL